MENNLSPLSNDDRRKLLFFSNIVIFSIVSILITLRVLIVGSTNLPPPFPIPAILTITCCVLNLVYLWRGGATDNAARIFIATLLIGLALAGFSTYGISGPLVELAVLIPVFTLLLLDSRAAGISLVMGLVILTTLYGLDMKGLVPVNPNPTEVVIFARFITLATVYMVTTWGVWMFALYAKNLLVTIKKQSTTDHLTGVLNRRGLEVIMDNEVGRAKRNNTWLSVVMADVDFFKKYNDKNGHQMGDECLVKIVRLIQSCVTRQTDYVGRYGGEEFIIILPDTELDGAVAVSEKIRAEMIAQAIPYSSDNPDVVTLTLGVVSGQGGELKSSDFVINFADAALYEGKDRGRNCVVSQQLGLTEKG